ncbi:alpha/beta fold hydrolase [Azospirillum halopraeferens]|uniref:alpha/beta fold hydrolase n=1 Tax=Azospirillum halopraeferens TaxID=34010 RepID=UPI000402D2CB|nr:alpha/beta hydrolase [Azospirillum halopraeferens]
MQRADRAQGEEWSEAVLRRHGVTVAGRRGAVLVFGHGFATDQRVWGTVRAWADRRFRTVAFDLAGCGAAAGAYDDLRHATPDGFADDLLAVLDAAGVDRCVYLGHELGAMAGMLAALKAPDRFERLILLSAGACLLKRPGYRAGLDPLAVRSVLGLMTVNYPRWIREYAALAAGAPPDAPATVAVARSLAAMRPDIALAHASTLFQADLRGWVDGLTVPSVLVHGADDPVVPAAAVHHLHAVWPFAALDLLPGVGHMPHLTAADRVIGVLENRLKGVTTA